MIKSECTWEAQGQEPEIGNCKKQSLIQMSFSLVDFEFSKMALLILPVLTEITIYLPEKSMGPNVRLKLIKRDAICTQLCYELALGP